MGNDMQEDGRAVPASIPCAGATASVPERHLLSEWHEYARAGHATGSRSSDGSGILYHGTSAKRWELIKGDRTLRVAPYGVQGVSMTDSREVAAYFADLAADCDCCAPVVLRVDASALIADGFELEPFEDGVWGEEECAWERETVCWRDIPITYVSVDTDPQGIARKVAHE